MNLEAIPTTAHSILSAHPAFAAIPVLLDEGQHPNIPALEPALREPGIAVVISLPQYGELVVNDRRSLSFRQTVRLAVEVHENSTANVASIRTTEALRVIAETLSGKPAQNPNHERFTPVAIDSIQKENGGLLSAVIFEIQNDISPE